MPFLKKLESDALYHLKQDRKYSQKRAMPLIMQRNKAKRVSCVEKYLKADFSQVIFTDEFAQHWMDHTAGYVAELLMARRFQ